MNYEKDIKILKERIDRAQIDKVRAETRLEQLEKERDALLPRCRSMGSNRKIWTKRSPGWIKKSAICCKRRPNCCLKMNDHPAVGPASLDQMRIRHATAKARKETIEAYLKDTKKKSAYWKKK